VKRIGACKQQYCDIKQLSPSRACRIFPRHRRPSMRMFETAASSMLAIAAQALVVGVIISTL
jgi:hypothetical protein